MQIFSTRCQNIDCRIGASIVRRGDDIVRVTFGFAVEFKDPWEGG
jgi:hypothetical protein